MSSIYITEPGTKGKVILKTTLGYIDIELWSREAPKACRNFVQLCMEGYYDNTIFHRIIKNFIMQGGDPTGTGFTSESIYGGHFPDEFHSRLRFSHRGIVALAGSHGESNNGSQFFITLDKTPDLQAKHTIFGKVTGDTIFNILKANDAEVDDKDRPLFPPKIISIDVVNNPFDDIIPREFQKKKEEKEIKGKPAKNMNLLSFGEEAEAEEEELSSINISMKSTYAFSESAEERESAKQADLRKQKHIPTKEEEEAASAATKLKQSIANHSFKEDQDDDQDFATKMREKVKQSKKKFHLEEEDNNNNNKEENQESSRFKELAEQQNAIKRELLEMKKKKKDKESEETKEVGKTLLEQQRAKYLDKYQAKKRKRGQPVNESLVLGKLEGFKKTIRGAVLKVPEEPETDAPPAEEKIWDPLEMLKDVDNLDEGNSSDWISHTLKFEKLTKSKDAMLRNDDDSYTSYDPLKDKKNKDSHQSNHKKRLSSQKKMDKW